ncbi:MAG: PAS domain-containing protein [Bacteroidota bacterium]
MDSRILKKLKACSKDEESFEELKSLYKDVDQQREQAQNHLNLLESAIRNDYDSIVITELELEKPGPKIVYVNEGFCKMTGYTRDEVIGKTPRILQGPKTDRAVLDRLKKRLIEGKSFFGQAVNYRKDGSEFIIQWDIHPLTNEEGEITHWVSFQHDITERRRAEQRLVDTDVEFDDLEEEAHCILVDVDEQGNVVMASKAFRELVGYDNEELKEIKVWDLLPGKFKRSLHGRFSEVFKPEEFDGKTYRALIEHRTGVPIQIEVSSRILKTKDQTIVRADVKNISMQKRVLRTLQKRNNSFKKVFSQRSDFRYTLALDDDHTPIFQSVSDNITDVTGWNENEVLAKGQWSKLIHPDDKEAVLTHYNKALKGHSNTQEYRLKRKDGTFIKVVDYARPVWDEQQEKIVRLKGAVTVQNQNALAEA